MVLKYPDGYDDSFINTIKEMIDHIKVHGKTIQDLVAEGQLTEEQYQNLLISINGLIKKGDIKLSDLDKNNMKFDQTWMADSLLQQIAGDAPVNATPPNGGVTTPKIADKAATMDKRTPMGELPLIYAGQSGGNINLITGSNMRLEITGTMFITHGKNNYAIPGGTVIDLSTLSSAARMVFFDTESQTFTVAASSAIGYDTGYNENHILIAVVFTSDSKWQMNINSDNYTINGNPPVDLSKRTPMGELPMIYGGASGGTLNLEQSTVNGIRFIFTDTMFMVHRNKRYTIPPQIIDANNVSSTGRYLWFNVKTEDFRVTTQSIMSDENYILVAIAYAKSSGDYTNDWFLLMNSHDYSVNGVPLYQPYDAVGDTDGAGIKPEGMAIETIIGDIVDADLPGTREAGNPFDRTNDTHELVYGLFDEFMADYPEYVTKEEIGRSTRDIPIYVYHFNPERAPVTAGENVKGYPQIILDASIHGGENLATDTLYFLMERIVNDWETDERLEYLRHYVNFSVLAMPNPDDYNDKMYNSTGHTEKNLNRDFGDFERVESQHIRDFFESNADALLFVDCHVRGAALSDDKDLMWVGSSRKEELPILTNTIEKMTRRWKKKYPALSGVSGQLGYITNRDQAGTIKTYVHNNIGIKSILWEGFKASPTITDFEGKQVVDMNVDYLSETVLNIVKHHQ